MALSEEHKVKMAEGRRLARERRVAKREQAEFYGTAPAMHAVRELEAENAKITVQEFLGITNDECPVACTMAKCAISGKPYCAHPRKCGLHPIDKVDPLAVERYNRARKVLAFAEVGRQK